MARSTTPGTCLAHHVTARWLTGSRTVSSRYLPRLLTSSKGHRKVNWPTAAENDPPVECNTGHDRLTEVAVAGFGLGEVGRFIESFERPARCRGGFDPEVWLPCIELKASDATAAMARAKEVRRMPVPEVHSFEIRPTGHGPVYGAEQQRSREGPAGRGRRAWWMDSVRSAGTDDEHHCQEDANTAAACSSGIADVAGELSPDQSAPTYFRRDYHPTGTLISSAAE